MSKARREAIYDVETRTYRIPLTREYFAVVDFADIEWLTQWSWHAHIPPRANGVYAMRNERIGDKRGSVYMHRALASHWGWPVDGFEIDHITVLGGLDNRRQNLRVVTRTQNRRNRPHYNNSCTKVKGVYFHKRVRKFAANIKVDGKTIYLGYFDTVAEAATAYEAASLKYHGDFGRTEAGSNTEKH